MNLQPLTLHHGEVYGSLTVLGVFERRCRGNHWRVGCACGNSKEHYSARKLMRGLVKACSRCRKQSCKSDE